MLFQESECEKEGFLVFLIKVMDVNLKDNSNVYPRGLIRVNTGREQDEGTIESYPKTLFINTNIMHPLHPF